MNKNSYERTVFTVTWFDAEDVIVTSGNFIEYEEDEVPIIS